MTLLNKGENISTPIINDSSNMGSGSGARVCRSSVATIATAS